MSTTEDSKTRNKKISESEINERRIRFLGKRMYLSFNPRTGICSICGKKENTHMHHEKYVPCIPWACTKEVCKQHHYKFTKNDAIKSGQLWGKTDKTINNEIKTCEHCNRQYKRRLDQIPSKFRESKFCSNDCKNKWLKEMKRDKKGRFVFS